LNERYAAQEKTLQTCQLNLRSETVNSVFSPNVNTCFQDTREVISQKLQNQNQKLLALRDFLRTVFETNNDNYIDLVLGENRAGTNNIHVKALIFSCLLKTFHSDSNNSNFGRGAKVRCDQAETF
jgi:hypothetical protein